MACSTLPVQGAGFDPVASGYQLTFDEEFNHLSVSNDGVGTTWESKAYWMGNNNRKDLLDPSICGLGYTPFALTNGGVQIQARPTPPALTQCGGIKTPYTGGRLDTHNSFSQEYGYFETRAKISNVYGTIFAFWLLPQDGSWPPEIDITEMLGRLPGRDNVTNHTNDNGFNNQRGFRPNVGDLSQAFHTYAVKWDPENITWYLDGQQVGQTPTASDEHRPFYMVVNFNAGRCGDRWADCPRNSANFIADADVKWVRAWQPPGGSNKVIKPQTGFSQ